VHHSKQVLKTLKNQPSGPRIGVSGRSSSALRAGESVRALTMEMVTDTARVSANCLYSCPVMPPMNATGTKTAMSTRDAATIGPVTSRMAFLVASRADRPSSSMRRCTASTTTMASSTTMPMASTKPKSVRVLMEKPRAVNAPNVPTSETGTAIIGMIVVRQFCRKMKTTTKTRNSASYKVCITSSMEAVTKRVVS